MFRKIWIDPVGSKVISAAILALCAYIYSIFSTDTFGVVISKVWYYKIGLGWTIFIVTVLITIQGIWNKKSNSSIKMISDSKNQKQENFRRANTKILFGDDILVRFTTWFSSSSGLPFIDDEIAYCNLHPAPMRMNLQGCPERNCKHNDYQIDMRIAKHKIESILVDHWEKSNGL